MILPDSGGSVSDDPNEIVGHKTFSTGELDPATGFPMLRHEPLTRAEAAEIWARVERAAEERKALMPDEKAALRILTDAHTRLKELGWREAIYCPKDGSHFQVIEAGSIGIFDCAYEGEWPAGSWSIFDPEEGPCPSRPILFKLYPEDQAKYDARMAEFRRIYKAEQST